MIEKRQHAADKMFKILSLYARFFSCSFITWHCYRDLFRKWQALELKTNNLKNTCCPCIQRPRALISTLTSLEMFDILPCSFFPENGVSLGSVSVSLQTFDITFAVRSRKSLCRVDVKSSFLQFILCSVSNLLPQG